MTAGKVENGVVRACYKRPVATADIQKVVDRIETKVFSMEEKRFRAVRSVRPLWMN